MKNSKPNLKWCSYHRAAEPRKQFASGRYACKVAEVEYTKRRRKTFNGRMTTLAQNLGHRHNMKVSSKELIAWLGQPEICYLCGNGFNEDYVVDHLIPVSAGGTCTEHNLDWAHNECNRAKGDLPIFTFANLVHTLDQQLTEFREAV